MFLFRLESLTDFKSVKIHKWNKWKKGKSEQIEFLRLHVRVLRYFLGRWWWISILELLLSFCKCETSCDLRSFCHRIIDQFVCSRLLEKNGNLSKIWGQKALIFHVNVDERRWLVTFLSSTSPFRMSREATVKTSAPQWRWLLEMINNTRPGHVITLCSGSVMWPLQMKLVQSEQRNQTWTLLPINNLQKSQNLTGNFLALGWLVDQLLIPHRIIIFYIYFINMIDWIRWSERSWSMKHE